MRIKLFAILLFLTCFASAQTYEIGAFAGGSNYIGDVGPTTYINPNSVAIGGLAKWNLSNRYSYRLSVIYTQLQSDDADSENSARQQRDFSFENDLLEVSVGMEFNFVEFNLHDFSNPVTPYIYGGVSYVRYNDLYFEGNTAEHNRNKSTFAIPMALGVKGKIGTRFVLGGEIGARYTFTNNLDGSDPGTQDVGINPVRFGNSFSDDWFVFTGVTLTYTFGKKPCYYCFD
ncbi:DUF6089 family protein [Robertkochia aurantiaca]|uniref:type IX secretion system protein PorG n=1 Tax=Robertkochia aurantiaca TaxID=2873700 RepID=UPI001CCE7638|nr:DUF6089 family protein [Robertkochia sp. 3YJGBD-33]